MSRCNLYGRDRGWGFTRDVQNKRGQELAAQRAAEEVERQTEPAAERAAAAEAARQAEIEQEAAELAVQQAAELRVGGQVDTASTADSGARNSGTQSQDGAPAAGGGSSASGSDIVAEAQKS